jgi:sialate O-acetylesterase
MVLDWQKLQNKTAMLKFSYLLLLLCSHNVLAELRLPKLINDHMVLQRDIEVPIWGYADTGEAVTVKLDGKIVGKTIANNGKWRLKLAAQSASGPHQISISASNTIVLKDVYFGDVWLASGQSNMELQMYRVAEDYPADLKDVDYPLIRHFMVPQKYNFQAPQDDLVSGHWEPVSAQNISHTPAVSYYFAKQLFKHNGVAIGIINNALGGSPIESWLSAEVLQNFPEALAQAKQFSNEQYVESVIAADKAKNAKWYGDIHKNDMGLNADSPWYSSDLDDSDWARFNIPGERQLAEGVSFNGVWWLRKTVKLSAAQAKAATIIRMGTIVDADEVYINSTKVGNTTYQYPPRRYTLPEGLLKQGDNQITVRVIANNGGSSFVAEKPYWLGTDEHHVSLNGEWKAKTGTLAPSLAGDTFVRWKAGGLYNGLTAPLTTYPIKGVIWYQGESNAGRWHDYQAKFSAMIQDWRAKWGQGDFPFIFAQLANYMEAKTQSVDSDWAELRHAQTQTLAEPNTAMAVAIDIGEWNDIHPTNKKALAERLALAARALALHEDVVYQGPQIDVVTVQQNQLILNFKHIADGLVLKNINDHSFAIAGEDGLFKWADTELLDNQIILSNPDINLPKMVRYAWADNPDAALYNSVGLPAVPFSVSLMTAE